MSRVLCCLLVAISTSTSLAAEGVVLPATTLRDHRGTEHALAETGDAKAVVLAFLGTECPLARLYGRRLAELNEQYAERGVRFLGVNANVQDTLTEVTAYANRYGVGFPVLMDNDASLADAVGARRTPEVLLFDADRRLRYRGRVDDQYAISVARKEPTRRDLVEAIDAVLAGDEVAVAETKPVGCLIGRPRTVEPTGDITYTEHVAAILDRRCAECHREGEIAPFPLTSYEDTVGWGAMIAEVVDEGRMPPWNANPKHGVFSNDARLTPEEKRTLLTWIGNGSPEGDPAKRPPKPEFTDGWRIGEPDLVVAMRDEPYDVPATGVVDYQYFRVKGFDEDRYVNAIEARPGNRSVVHHIVVYLRDPERKKARPDEGPLLVGYAPGTQPLRFDDGEAIRIPAGYDMVFELHYTPNGRPQRDLSHIGMQFVEKESVEKTIHGAAAINHDFRIPPGVADHVVTAEHTVRHDIDLISLTPHMHLRGKAFRYEAYFPGEKEPEVLLDVPAYDFNWQLRYELAERRHLPKGTRVVCTAVFDNSPGNANNPNPRREIGWGRQSWDEMMIGFFTCVPH